MAKKAGLKADGKLKKGCRFLKGGRVSCKKGVSGVGKARKRRRR
jgi:hypothetical protein